MTSKKLDATTQDKTNKSIEESKSKDSYIAKLKAELKKRDDNEHNLLSLLKEKDNELQKIQLHIKSIVIDSTSTNEIDSNIVGDTDVHILQKRLQATERRLRNAKHLSDAHQEFARGAQSREERSKKIAIESSRRLKISEELLNAMKREKEIQRLEEQCMKQYKSIQKLEKIILEYNSDPLLQTPLHATKRKKLIDSREKLTKVRSSLKNQTLLVDQLNNKQKICDLIRNNANNGNENEVIELLQKGATINIPDEFGMTAFIYACKNGHKNIVKLLIPSADIHGEHGQNIPLCIAVTNSHLSVIGILLDHGADIEQTDGTGKTPLLIACKKLCFGCVSILLDKGANIEARDRKGNTCLHLVIACTDKKYNGNETMKIVRLLMDMGVNSEINNANNLTAFQLASLKGLKTILEMLSL